MFRTEDGVNLPMSMRFHRYVNSYWSAFIRDCVDEILTIGILVVAYEVVRDKVDGTVLIAPYVIKGELGSKYTITVGPDATRLGQLRFRFYRLVDQYGNACQPTYDPSVHIFHGFGYDPLSDGRLRSVVSSIVWQERYISKMYFYALRIEQTRSSGTIYIESTQAPGPAAPIDTYFADGDQVHRQDEMYWRKTERELEESERARTLASVNIMSELIETNINTTNVRDGVDLFESVGANTKIPIVPIPDGRRVARSNDPASVQNWASINRIYQDYVCTRYGVPREMLFSDGQRGTKDHSSLVRSQFEQSISVWKRALEQVLECVYNELFADDDADFMFADTVVQTLRKRPRTLDDDDDDDDANIGGNDSNNADGSGGGGGDSSNKKRKTNSKDLVIANHNIAAFGGTGRATVRMIGDNTVLGRAMAADEKRAQLMEFRKTLRSTVRQNGSVPEDKLADVVDRLSHTALPALIKEINQLPDSVDTEDPLFTVYADRLLDVVRERTRRHRVRISYVSIPHANIEDLFVLYTQGILKWDEYEQAVRAANNLPVHLTGTPEPWSFEQKAAMLGIGETVVHPGVEASKSMTAATSRTSANSKSKLNNNNNNNNNKKNTSKDESGDEDDDDDKTTNSKKKMTVKANDDSDSDDGKDESSTTDNKSKKRKRGRDKEDRDDDSDTESKKAAKRTDRKAKPKDPSASAKKS
jgi:hypothetical protein